jgi:F0F1-type ATP synthase membrane subunit b/b'
MLPSWVDEALKANGLAGVFIFILIIAIVAVVKLFLGILKSRDKEIKELHEQRAQERETLVKLLESANTAQRITADATSKRTELMNDQTEAVMSLANSNERLNDRFASHTEMTKERLSAIREIIGSTGESTRILNGIVTDIRNNILKLVDAQNDRRRTGE